MPSPVAIAKAALEKMIGRMPSNNDLQAWLIQSIFSPNYDTTASTAVTLTADDWGKRFVFTSGSAITLTIPSGLPSGFIVSGIARGAGTVTFSGVDAGSATSAGQNKPFAIEVLPDGTRLASGGA